MSLSMLQEGVGPKAGTPGTAQESAPSPNGPPPQAPNTLMMFLPFLILVPFLFLSFRRQKKEQEQRSKLKKGDRVVTTSGLIGELVELEERVAKVKIAPGTTVQVLSSSVSPFELVSDKSKTDKELSDLKSASEKK